jgi:hypothetical protein
VRPKINEQGTETASKAAHATEKAAAPASRLAQLDGQHHMRRWDAPRHGATRVHGERTRLGEHTRLERDHDSKVVHHIEREMRCSPRV